MFRQTWWAGTSWRGRTKSLDPAARPCVQLWPLPIQHGPQGCQVRWLVWPFMELGNPAPPCCIHGSALEDRPVSPFTCLSADAVWQPNLSAEKNSANSFDHITWPLTSTVQLDWLKGSDRAKVKTLFLTVTFSEMLPVSSVKGPRDEIVLHWQCNPIGNAVFTVSGETGMTLDSDCVPT